MTDLEECFAVKILPGVRRRGRGGPAVGGGGLACRLMSDLGEGVWRNHQESVPIGSCG